MSWRWIAALTGLALVRSLTLGVLTPPYQASDEPWHLDYARAVADGDLPVMGETLIDPEIVEHDLQVSRDRDLTVYGIDDPPRSREAFQPPLAYLAPALGYLVAGGPEGGLLAFRTVNALWGALLAVVAFGAARRAFPSAPHAGPVAGLTAVLLPSVAAVASSANNDALAAVLGVATLGAAAGLARTGGTARAFAGLGGLVGVAGLTKASGLALAAPVAVAALVAPTAVAALRWRRLAWALGTAAAVSIPWAIRNLVEYGDLVGTGAFDRFNVNPGRDLGGFDLLLGTRPSHPEADPFWPGLWRSTVGMLRWTDLSLPGWAYWLAGAAAAAAMVLVVRWLLEGPATADRRAAAVIGAAGIAYLAGAVWYAMMIDYQPQGRYLVPALPAAAGLVGAVLGRRGLLVGGAVLVVLLAAAEGVTASTYGLP